jgi:hypothetical protein
MAADWGTPYPLRCTNRPPGRPAACERADRLTLGDSTPRGPRRQLGGGLPRLSPDKREGGLPGTGRGVSESAGRGAAKEKGEGQKDPRGGEGTPRRDPGGPAGRSRPNGRVVATKGPQPRRPRPICGGAVRPTGPATVWSDLTGPTTAFPGRTGTHMPAAAERRKRAG